MVCADGGLCSARCSSAVLYGWHRGGELILRGHNHVRARGLRILNHGDLANGDVSGAALCQAGGPPAELTTVTYPSAGASPRSPIKAGSPSRDQLLKVPFPSGYTLHAAAGLLQ